MTELRGVATVRRKWPAGSASWTSSSNSRRECVRACVCRLSAVSPWDKFLLFFRWGTEEGQEDQVESGNPVPWTRLVARPTSREDSEKYTTKKSAAQ